MRKLDRVVTIRCRADNYAYLVHDPASGMTALFDAPDAGPIADELALRGWRLTDIVLTHHHDDHIAGVAALRDGARVIGHGADAHRLPQLDLAVSPGETFAIGTEEVQVIAAPGHTLGHVAYHMPSREALFSGDSLMVHGCGRLFEGTAEQMHAALTRMARLPDRTCLYSGHDYARANLDFAARFAPDPAALSKRQNQLRVLAEERWPTTGLSLGEDKQLNPYLRVHLPQVKAAAGLPEGTDAAVFAEIRRRKDAA